MPSDLQSIQSLLAILGTIGEWIGKVWRSAASHVGSRRPTKTVILIPVWRQNALWWHMGLMGDQPAMQIAGELGVTNISKSHVYLMGAKLRKPKTVGHTYVRVPGSNILSYTIPEGGVGDLRFDFFVQPPVCAQGRSFKTDVAIVDQFGNEHWVKRLEFPYS
jgi:hypothetical protein